MSDLFDAAPESREAAAPPSPYRVLARKYRPTRFDDLIGQDAMVRVLRNAFAQGRVAHAFMLTGVRGVGKTTTARIIARALNCIGPDGKGGPTADPCGVCPVCRAILADRHPDVIEMDAASRTGVDDVREIIEATHFRPLEARNKVFIIDEVHMLSRNAFNALLKTLEEPPPHVTFVFATTEIRKVPVTVLSRCQRFDLRRVGLDELVRHFAAIAAKEGYTAEEEALRLIARAADGSVRDGLSLLDQALAELPPGGRLDAGRVTAMLGLADREMVFDLLEALLGGRLPDVLALSERAYAHGADFGTLIDDLLGLIHLLSRLKAVPELAAAPELAEAERTRGVRLAEATTIPHLMRAWQILLKGKAEVETAADPRAAAEMVFIRLAHAAEFPPPGQILERLLGENAASALPAERSPSPPPRSAPRGSAALAPDLRPSEAERPDPALPASAPVRRPESFREALAWLAEAREPLLHAELVHHAHLVRFAPPVIELRLEAGAPRDLAARLAASLSALSGERWTVVLSSAPGEPTLAEQERDAERKRRTAALSHPLVQAVFETFPGAQLIETRPLTETVALEKNPDEGEEDFAAAGERRGDEDMAEEESAGEETAEEA
jgi:DNA polymerase-3 subunit gamma/tau